MPPDIQPICKVVDELSIEDGVIMRDERCIPPLNVRAKLVDCAHDGHLGATMTKRRQAALLVAIYGPRNRF